ncbi:arsenic resistance N-acetyltransferase ArsN2 [Qipengyuania sp. 483]
MNDLAAALAADGLPYDDLSEPGRQFYVIRRADRQLGYIGIEGTGSDRLLRSFVIPAEHRSAGVGREALAALEGHARDAGTKRLHLLTTTAAEFFRRSGYQPASREDAPNDIAGSREFTTLCPASAEYLVKEL